MPHLNKKDTIYISHYLTTGKALVQSGGKKPILKVPEPHQVPPALEGRWICPVASGGQDLSGISGVAEPNIV